MGDTSVFIAVLDMNNANHAGAAETWQNILTGAGGGVGNACIVVEALQVQDLADPSGAKPDELLKRSR